MNSHAAFDFNEMLSYIIGDMAQAVSERGGETKQQQYARAQGSTAMILDLHPRDAAEAMLAGHCVMFNAVIGDSARDTLRGEADTMRRATRSNLVALNKSFFGNLDRLEQYHGRPALGLRDGSVAHAAGAGAAAPVPAQPEPSRDQPPHADSAPIAAAEARASHGTPAHDLAAKPDTRGPAAASLAVRSDAALASTATSNGTRFLTAAVHAATVHAATVHAATVPATTIPAATIPAAMVPAGHVPGNVPGNVPGDVPGNDPGCDENRAPVAARTGFQMVAGPAKVSPAEPPSKASAVASSARPDSLPTYLREDVVGFKPSAETIAACRANPEAMAALAAGDPARFARAMGVAAPSQDYLSAAAAPGSPFDVRNSTGTKRPDPSRPSPVKTVT